MTYSCRCISKLSQQLVTVCAAETSVQSVYMEASECYNTHCRVQHSSFVSVRPDSSLTCDMYCIEFSNIKDM